MPGFFNRFRKQPKTLQTTKPAPQVQKPVKPKEPNLLPPKEQENLFRRLTRKGTPVREDQVTKWFEAAEKLGEIQEMKRDKKSEYITGLRESTRLKEAMGKLGDRDQTSMLQTLQIYERALFSESSPLHDRALRLLDKIQGEPTDPRKAGKIAGTIIGALILHDLEKGKLLEK
ncbi:MAG: hypothetical protein Q7K34_01995 [archaeon]|nr:hypothetical protein [archaeon]